MADELFETDLTSRWIEPRWLDEATAWIHQQVERTGASLASQITQPHIEWWSTVLRVPTSEGVLWFKAVADVHAFEVPLAVLLARLQPERVPKVLASDVGRGWMLMRDGGTRLRDLMKGREDLHHWESLLPRYADLQIQLAPRAAELLAVGVPDERLAGLPARVARLVDDREFLLLDLTDGLTSQEYAQLQGLLPEVATMCQALAGYAIPETLQHDDLHDGNVFFQGDAYHFFDWGDSCVSHPFHTLTVTLRALAWKLDLEPGGRELVRLRDAYLERFERFGERRDLIAAADLGYRTGTLARALAWHRFVVSGPAEHRADDVSAVPYGLKRFLERGPIGSWR